VAQNAPIQFGDYRLLRKIAQGGMAEIFLAQDHKGNVCALKRILPHLAHEEGFIRMFIDEARIVSHLDHPNIARVIKQDKHEGYYYIAMEYVEGHSLLSLSDRARSQKIPLPRGLLAYIVAELLAALASAHAARDHKGRHLQIVHRDVTPQNVLIAYDGGVKLIDFGVAKARARLTKTEAGFTKGKLSYMSPEQAKGEELDGRSDLFSVGIILYEITTGVRLFNKEGPGGILGAIVNDQIPSPSHKDKNYPKELETIVMRALEKSPDRRWQAASDMQDALARFARKEKPAPGKSRLSDLVHDLFGEPEHRKLIESAQPAGEPTPAGAVKAQLIESAPEPEPSVELKSTHLGSEAEQAVVSEAYAPAKEQKSGDDTRMMKFEAKSGVSAVSKKQQVTAASIPAVNLVIPPEEAPVPEPKVPLRVRIGRLLTELTQDAKAGFAVHKKRVLTTAGIAVTVVALVVMYLTGATSALAAWLGGAAVKAREYKKSAGLGPAEAHDAGLQPTVLKVQSEPPGAMIAIDGLGAGCVTPCTIKDPTLSQPIRIELTLNGFKARTEKLTLWPNQGEKDLSVVMERQLGVLSVESEPPGAFVLADGARLKGTTPLVLDGVRAGVPLKIDVEKPGFLPRSRMVILADGETKTERFELVGDPAAVSPGRIDVETTPAGCALRLDGESVGAAPLRGRAVKAGMHTLRASCEFYAPDERTVVVRAGQTAVEKMVLEPAVFGYLTIHVEPEEGTVVTINGRRVPLPVEFVKVVPGRHVVEVKNAQLDRRQSINVDVGPEKRISRTVKLF
jgi:serine/threonine-protein kinase